MNRAEREAHPEDSFDGGYHLYAEQKHREHVAKNPERLEYAIAQLKAHNIEFSVKNPTTGHIHARRKTDDALIQFYAGTGKIMDHHVRGIHNLILICEGEIR